MNLEEIHQERYLKLYRSLNFLHCNWDVIRQHFLHIQSSPMHACVKILLLGISVMTIFVDSSLIILATLIIVPLLFSLNIKTFDSIFQYFGNTFKINVDRWNEFTFENFCESLTYLSFQGQSILVILCDIYRTCPLFALVSINLFILNFILLWQSLTLVRIIALSLIVMYTTPVLWLYQLDVILINSLKNIFRPKHIMNFILTNQNFDTLHPTNNTNTTNITNTIENGNIS